MLERVWSAKEEKRRRGELAQSKIVLPWGVDYENGRFFYKPEAEKVREAFRQFLGGKQNYLQLSKMLGVTPRGLHLIMRNPIWTGLRVIDKKRDASSGGRYATIDGRQADRRKVFRSPEDVIRVRVITEPLISEEDFQAVQRIMDRKQSKHWRSRTDLQHRFTYNGFLTCSDCGDQIHTAFARRDYYACKGRRISHSCTTKYMARERLEEALDGLFADYLTKESFLHACIAETENRLADDEVLLRNQRLGVCLSSMREKRARAIDAFLEGVISKEDRDQRLFGVDREIGETENLLMQEIQPAMTAETMVRAFAPLVEWRSWTRDEKRLVLAALIPDIRVANYRVSAIGTDFSNESIPAPAASLIAERPLTYLQIPWLI